MFDHMIVAPSHRERRGWGSLSVAILGHLAILLGISSASYLIVETVIPPDAPITLTLTEKPDWNRLRVAPTPPSGRAQAVRSPAVVRFGVARSGPSKPTAVLQAPPTVELQPLSDPEVGDDGMSDETGSAGSPFGAPDGDGHDYRGVDPSGDGEGGLSPGPLPLTGEVDPPVLLVKVSPEYPEAARKARLSGRVFVKAVVSPRGDVVDVEVVSSTHALFEASALAAVRSWKYRPATLRGQPIAVHFTVIVSFTLR